MSNTNESRVAVYIDFDNIVISRYHQIHGHASFKRDRARELSPLEGEDPKDQANRIAQARVDLGAILDYASSFGTVAISRAYADWSVPVNANYQSQLVGRAVELVQMFPTVQSMKNGADIRMSVDVVEDLFRLPELTHVVIVSGDSDFIALAQRCRRLGRYIIGIGVAGGTSRALNAACNEYKDYDGLPGLGDEQDAEDSQIVEGGQGSDPAQVLDEPASGIDQKTPRPPGVTNTTQKKSPALKAVAPAAKTATAKKKTLDKSVNSLAKPAEQKAATNLLRRAMELAQSKDDVDWVASSGLKTQMLRMDPTFQEKLLGYKTFTDFLKSRGNLVEVREEGQLRFLRLREAPPSAKESRP